VTRVQFTTPRPSTPEDAPTAAIPARTFGTATADAPFDCFNPVPSNSALYECRFTVTADLNNAVAESSETNNTEPGFCQVSSSGFGLR
jgi:hypothetical protein